MRLGTSKGTKFTLIDLFPLIPKCSLIAHELESLRDNIALHERLFPFSYSAFSSAVGSEQCIMICLRGGSAAQITVSANFASHLTPVIFFVVGISECFLLEFACRLIS